MDEIDRETVLAVHALQGKFPSLRDIADELGLALSTTQWRVTRAANNGHLYQEPMLSNTVRIANDLVVHDGQVYQLILL